MTYIVRLMGYNRSYRAGFALVLLMCCFHSSVFSQPTVVHIQPDALAPGMTIAMELLAPANAPNSFGTDGIYMPDQKIIYYNPLDSFRAIFGPVTVSWNGRVMQVPVLVPSTASTGEVYFQVVNGNRKSDTMHFTIVTPQPISLAGNGTIDNLTDGNTLVVQSLDLKGQDFPRGTFRFTSIDPDTSKPGNPRYHPVIVLSQTTINLHENIELTVSAEGIDGGQGGGGGGHGNIGFGGIGYTGGGNDLVDSFPMPNIGSGDSATEEFGGASTTGVVGGGNVTPIASPDQGGGGGTGCPYGSSGKYTPELLSSVSGGSGGGSGGGETTGIPYGGGGGAFAENGEDGAGVGANGGRRYGGRFLIPLQGGSGGGAGNALVDADSAGSGGGGGGALTIISFDNIVISKGNITAIGSNGTSGKKTAEAGGGGGSGGGILIGARNGIVLDNQSSLDVHAGNGGLGGQSIESISRGGNGSRGRIVFAGDVSDTTSFSGVISSVPTVVLPTSPLKRGFATITGFAGSKNDLEDSIRIFFRDRHTNWRIKDTVRIVSNNKLIWRVSLPIGNDSLLFVTVFEKVHSPQSTFANFEPMWVTSHLSSAIISVEPSAELAVQSDTLDFGTIRFDTCITTAFHISNLGEATLHIDSLTVANPHFSVVPPIPTSLEKNGKDTLLIRYCPDSVLGCDTTTLTIYSKSGGTKKVVLLGCGNNKDERITIAPSALPFGRVHVDSCTTLTFVVRSIGSDPVTIEPDDITQPPYKLISPSLPTTLSKKGDSITITVQFCPTDSGSFQSTFVLTHRHDSITVSGTGIIRILKAPISLLGNALCSNSCDSIICLLFSDGNDTVRINQVIGATLLSPTVPFFIPPHAFTEITVQYCSKDAIDSTVTLHFSSNSDSAATTTITFHPIHIAITETGKTTFGPICLSAGDSSDVLIKRTGSDSLDFAGVHLIHQQAFSISAKPADDSLSVHIIYTPTVSGQDFDTLIYTILTGRCDSVVRIPLHGSATNGEVSIFPTTIDFGILEVDSCKEDSIVIALPCGNPASLRLSLPLPPFELLDLTDTSIIVTNGTSHTIRFRYCPTLGKKDVISLAVTGSSIDTTITLTGEGRSIVPSPYIRFHLESILNVTAGDDFTYRIHIDSIANASRVRALTASLTYDPTVLKANSIESLQLPKWSIVSGAELKPGHFSFAATGIDSLRVGPFALLHIKPYLSSVGSTALTLDSIKPDISSILATDKGFVTVVTCSDPPGTRIISGSYHFDGIRSNPVTSVVSFEATIGAAGPFTISLYDVTGSLVHRSWIGDQQSGKHRFDIDVSGYAAGVYNLTLESWGWRGGSSFIITK